MGRGWHEKPKFVKAAGQRVAPRHRKAAFKGWRTRRQQPPKISKKATLRMHLKRSDRARAVDHARPADKTYKFKNVKGRYRWYKRPNQYDLEGVDTPDAPPERQDPANLKYTKPEYKKPKGKSKRQRGLTEREKDKVRYIMDTTDSSWAQARGLYYRAKHKGVSYDKVDWDAIQGEDLVYSEKVEKLEKQIGPTEAETPRDIQTREEMFKQSQEEYLQRKGAI